MARRSAAAVRGGRAGVNRTSRQQAGADGSGSRRTFGSQPSALAATRSVVQGRPTADHEVATRGVGDRQAALVVGVQLDPVGPIRHAQGWVLCTLGARTARRTRRRATDSGPPTTRGGRRAGAGARSCPGISRTRMWTDVTPGTVAAASRARSSTARPVPGQLDGAVVDLDHPVAQADGGEGRVDVALEVVVGARQHVDHVAATDHAEHPAVGRSTTGTLFTRSTSSARRPRPGRCRDRP